MSKDGSLFELNQKQACLIEAAAQEFTARQHERIMVFYDAATMLAICGGLQLALRHPDNRGPAAVELMKVIAQLIHGLKVAGFENCAELAEAGNDPSNDSPAYSRKKANA
jgi:hypothetical protein